VLRQQAEGPVQLGMLLTELEQVEKLLNGPWEDVLEARGAKKMLALLQRMVTLKQREEESHVRYLRQAQGR